MSGSGWSRRAVLTVGVGTAAAAMAGCSPPSGRAGGVLPRPEEPATTETVEPEPELPTWPLTGVEAATIEDRPALSVKVENSAQARPQTGLQHADVVFEEMVEGGQTRFNAVFHSDIPEVVGPIRSLRPMDAAISAPFGGVFAFSGGQHRFVDQVAATGLTMLSHDAGAPGFYRDSSRRAPHNVYGRTGQMLEAAGEAEPPPPQFLFAASEEQPSALAGERTEHIELVYPGVRSSWDWDGTDAAWLRSDAGAPSQTTDAGRLWADNIVIMRVEVRNSGALDPGGSPVPETILTGSGEAVVATGGHRVEVTWSKAETASVIELTAAADQDVLLAPGTTWVELLPISSSVRFE